MRVEGRGLRVEGRGSRVAGRVHLGIDGEAPPKPAPSPPLTLARTPSGSRGDVARSLQERVASSQGACPAPTRAARAGRVTAVLVSIGFGISAPRGARLISPAALPSAVDPLLLTHTLLQALLVGAARIGAARIGGGVGEARRENVLVKAGEARLARLQVGKPLEAVRSRAGLQVGKPLDAVRSRAGLQARKQARSR